MERVKLSNMESLNADRLISIAYGINGAGGGGNLLELYNPTGEKGIIGLVQELGNETISLVAPDKLPSGSTVCCIARLGRPGARADQYAQIGAQALVAGLKQLSHQLQVDIPKAIFPVEATAGQMARAVRAARAASSALDQNFSIVDGDLCGGLAVPAVPLAFNIYSSLKRFPDVAFIELKDKNDQPVPQITLIKESDPAALENKLRSLAGANEFGAVWFAWLLSKVSDFERFFTIGSVSNSIARGEIVGNAIKNGEDPAEALLSAGEIEQIVARGKVTEVKAENIPGFAQFSYKIETSEGKVKMAARNEYIVVYDDDGRVLVKAPQIINVLGRNGPIQSHVLKTGDEIVVISAEPQCLINTENNPPIQNGWRQKWQEYWDSERERGTWSHPY